MCQSEADDVRRSGPVVPPGLAVSCAYIPAMNRWTIIGRPSGTLPDPRAFVDHALGAQATEPVRFAAAAAESKSEAIGLVLMSPAFQRR